MDYIADPPLLRNSGSSWNRIQHFRSADRNFATRLQRLLRHYHSDITFAQECSDYRNDFVVNSDDLEDEVDFDDSEVDKAKENVVDAWEI